MKLWIVLLIIAMAVICTIILCAVYNQVVEYYHVKDMDHTTLGKLQNKIKRLCKYADTIEDTYKRKRLQDMCNKLKTVKIYQDESGSYTIGKKDVYMCLNDNNGSVYNDNMLTHVLLHECAHVCNETIGHDELFDEKFSFLQMCADEAGIYDSSQPLIMDYCKRKSNK